MVVFPNIRLSLPPANEVREGYVFTGVCLSTGACIAGGVHGRGCALWGHAWHGGVCGRGGMNGKGVCVAGDGVYGDGGGMHGWGGMHATHATWLILRDTVNEWAVRTLLECILV